MKSKILLLFIAIFTISCSQKGELDWLLGDWKRKNHPYFETWKKVNQNHYEGFCYSISEGDTVNKEFMSLKKANDLWTLGVQFQDEKSPTYFQVTTLDSNSFISENKSNEFPTHIKYFSENSEIKAIIWNSELDIKFDFEKLK